jgi:thioredoxin 1
MSKVLYFSAEWCGPCKAMKPIISKFEEEHPDFQIEKIDADDNYKLAAEHNVRAIPTFILLGDNGEELKRKQGAFNATAFNEFIYGE